MKLNKYSKFMFAMTGLMLGLSAGPVRAVQIFYESFESPIVAGRTSTTPSGWTSTRTDKTGLSNTALAGKTGSQYAYVDDYPNNGLYDGALTTTASILSSYLTTNLRYTLTCNVSGQGTGDAVAIDLLAGTNVLSTVTDSIDSITNLSAKTLTIKFIAIPGHANLGQTLAIRLRRTEGIYQEEVYFDNLSLDATSTISDVTPPSPGTMVWVGLPSPDVNNSITMQATNATDANLVQYYFTNTVNGHVSGWQDSPIWRDTHLAVGSTNSYRVMARDKSANLNETAWSTEESAVVEEFIILRDSFENPMSTFPSVEWGTYPGFTPPGWVRYGGRTSTYNESYASITTPYGLQVIGSFLSGATPYTMETTSINKSLKADHTYTLSFNAGNVDGATWSPRSDNQYTVELIAGTSVVSSVSAITTTKNMSQSNSLSLITTTSHPKLGGNLKVKLYMSGGDWHASALFDNIKLKAVPPAGPAWLTAVQGTKAQSVQLNWAAVASATGYNIKRAVTNYEFVTIWTTTATSYTDLAVEFNTNYYYVVSATNSYYETANSPVKSITPLNRGTAISIR